MSRLTLRPVRPVIVAALMMALAAAGCGYSIRPPFNPEIKTVYVPMFRSMTFQKNLNTQLTEMLQKEIMRRTPFKVVNNPDDADAILIGIINYVDKNIQVEAPTNLPRHLNALVTCEVKFYDNRPGAPTAPMQSAIVSETAPFYPELGETTQLAYLKTFDKMVRQIVGMMEKPWEGQ
ncbi:MAG TPA: LptE family protein [Isosphaeraceae bacterium]|nr:LptE family protein [Isosphaeraceae bacterium]